jgi:hypothetical protein
VLRRSACFAAVVSWTCVLNAGVIRGNVVENQTGKPLARAVVSLQPVTGTPGGTQGVRTNGYGAFEFSSLAAGAYLVSVSKAGFVPTEYGQKQWNAAGVPVMLTEDGAQFLTIRMPRYGAITGTVVDENDVGLPLHKVVAYRNTQPPVLAGNATADDRGVYRLGALEPGNYLVRTVAIQNEGIDYLPTFSKETLRVEEARMVPVSLDEESRFVDVRPAPGRLFTLSGRAEPSPQGLPVTVTLASDMGRQTVSGPDFEFRALPPGPYELYAESSGDPPRGMLQQAVFTPITLDRDTRLRLYLSPVRETRFDFLPSAPDAKSIQILARRKDLAGVWPVQPVTLTNNRAVLFPGRWELMLTPPPGFYVSGFSGPRSEPGTYTHPEGWNEITLGNFGFAQFTLSAEPGSMHGTVKSLGDTVAGAPVHLESYDTASRQRVTDLRTTRTDLHGAYRFDGLPPGTYRVLATFEYQAPDTAVMDQAGARQVAIEGKSDLQFDLDLYAIR